jgi:hypothetical protein
MNVVTPGERTAAAAVTNTARYTVRPLGPLAAGAVQHIALGAPLVLAGIVKAAQAYTSPRNYSSLARYSPRSLSRLLTRTGAQ